VLSEGGAVDSPYSLSPVGGDDALNRPSQRRTHRKIARSPFKVLDAPALQDDFYLNLVDWSSHNVLAVGLGTCVYLWSACTSRVTKLCDLGPGDSVCSVGWTQRGTYLAVGTNNGEVQIWDATKCKKVRGMTGHRTRVGLWRGPPPRSPPARAIETSCRGTSAPPSTTPANSRGTSPRCAV
jgi:cell division cycle 20-like protein 1, cofactor of APC complex